MKNKILPHLIDLFNEGKFPVRELTKIYPANRLDDAIEDLKSGMVGYFCRISGS